MKAFVCTIILSLTAVVWADIKSESGSLGLDVNNDLNNEVTIKSTGVGVGTSSPSSNLHIVGNAQMTQNLIIGDTMGNSNLEIHGSLGYGIEIVTTNTTLSGNSMILVDTSGGNLTLNLPNAATSKGRLYHIKKISSSGNLLITGGLMDDLPDIELKADQTVGPHVELLSGGGNRWYLMSMSGNDNMMSSENLVLWWKLDESDVQGSTLDSSDNGNVGTYAGSMTDADVVSGLFGNAIDLDGSNDLISDTSLSTSIDDDFSLSFYINFTSTDTQDRIIDLAQAGSTGLQVKNDGAGVGRISIEDSGGPDNLVISSGTYHDGEWHHILVTRTGVTYELFIDGESIGTDAGTAPTYTRLYIGGQSSGSNYFSGKFDDVRIYNKVLTTEEINNLSRLNK